MIATGDCGAETMVKNNHEVMQNIFPLFIHVFLSSYYPALNLPNIFNLPSETKQVRILSYGSNGLDAFSWTSFASLAFVKCTSSEEFVSHASFTFKQISLNTANVKLQVTSVTVLVFNVTCHQTTDTKSLSRWMPQKSEENCSALTLRILLPLSHSSLSYKTTAWWTIPHKSTAFPHFPFLLSTIHFHIFRLIAIFIGIPSGSLRTQRRKIFHCRVS